MDVAPGAQGCALGEEPKQRLPLAQSSDYSHFAVVRTKLKWSGGVIEKPER